MAWIGAFFGVGFAILMDFYSGIVIFGALGALIGYGISRTKSTSQDDSNNRRPRLLALEAQLNTVQEQLRHMSLRISLLEKKLDAEALASVDAALAPVRSDTTVAVNPVGKSETAQQTTKMPGDGVASKAVTAAQDAGSALKAPTPAPAERAAEAPPARLTVPVAQQPIIQPPVASTVKAQPAAPVTQKAATPPPPPQPPSAFQLFVQRWVFGGNPLVKVGVLILFLGLAFLLRYAAEHAVLPVEWRYAGVAAAGIGLLLAGWRWRHKKDNYGLILQGAGVAVLYLTTLAAMKLHPLIPVEFGFAVLIAVAAFAALLAILQDALVLAVIGTLGGFAAPVLASSGSGNHIALFSYLTLLNLGIVTIAWFKTWRSLNLIGYVGSFALGSGWAAKYYREELFATTEPFLLLLFVLYVLITFLFARRTLAQTQPNSSAALGVQVRQAASHLGYVDGTLAFGVPLSAFGLQYLLVKAMPYGAAFSALGFGLVYITLAFVLFRRTGQRYYLLTETMLAMGVIFGSLTIPLGLEQKWTSAAWAVEAAGVYWVGIRQQRPHARLFALLLLIGAAIYFWLGLSIADQGPVLDGSLLGCVLLAASAWWTYRLMRQAGSQQLSDVEIDLRHGVMTLGAIFTGALPFLLWPMAWASPALALLGTAAVFTSLRVAERPLLYWGWLYQALAGALFMTTLHSSDDGSVLSNGWTGLLAAGLIGVSMLASVLGVVRQSLASANANGAVKAHALLGAGTSVALLGGLAFINLAPLFILPWRFAAMIWPLTGLATLLWAVRMRHLGAVLFALALQAIAGVAHFGSRVVFYTGDDVAIEPTWSFMSANFWGPILISLAALICARLLHRPRGEHMPREVEISLGWVALGWSCAWWAFAWSNAFLSMMRPVVAIPSIVGVLIVTAWGASSLARRLNWSQLGQMTLAYLPSLTAMAALACLSIVAHPLASWGVLVWPAALVMHGILLRRQTAWVSGALLDLFHIAGAWVFVVLAAVELRWQFAQWGSADSAWPLLGWMVAPVAYLWALTSTKVQKLWPIRDHQTSYRVVTAVPIMLYLLIWVWISNAVSNGAASPLPYVPLLNPLEIAHVAVLLGVTLWWWSLRDHASLRGQGTLILSMTGATAFAVLTGSVVRTCHHWGSVAWRAHAMRESNLVQTSLSVTWAIVAIGLMLVGNRSRRRPIWIIGATLIAVVVGKLFLVELAASGSLARIVSFIVVGLLLLLVGYFAPLPPKHNSTESVSA